MKRLFRTDSKVRPQPLQDFTELESRLREAFQEANEHFELGYLFAYWDFSSWFKESAGASANILA